MPEGDTIHRSAIALDRALAGAVVVRVGGSAAGPRLRELCGRAIANVEARGKHLLVLMQDGAALRTHMRMSGSWHLYRPGERWQRPEHRARLVLETASAIAVCFDVPDLELIDARDLAGHPKLSTLGPDVLAADFSADRALERWRALGDREIGEALLDQGAVSGIGNIYKSESLFRARVHPFDPVSALSDEVLVSLAKAARRALGERVPRTERAVRAAPHAVYERRGLPCPRCGAPIERAWQGRPRRSTYFCPACQPRRSGGPAER